MRKKSFSCVTDKYEGPTIFGTEEILSHNFHDRVNGKSQFLSKKFLNLRKYFIIFCDNVNSETRFSQMSKNFDIENQDFISW